MKVYIAKVIGRESNFKVLPNAVMVVVALGKGMAPNRFKAIIFTLLRWLSFFLHEV